MQPNAPRRSARAALASLILATLAPLARADVVTDWNHNANEFIAEAKLSTPAAIRVMAIVQTAVGDAVDGAWHGGARRPRVSIAAAVAAANHAALSQLLPNQQAAVAAAYQSALDAIPDGAARDAGIAAGERAAAAVLAARANDGATTSVVYRPHTSAGAYVPTTTPAVPQWSRRKPWLMTSAGQFRPEAPPALDGGHWARDYDEVRRLGAKVSADRTPEQTDIARFWEYSLPSIYYGVLRSVALQPGRGVARNARLYAAASQAMDDALIAVFEAKYHYNFWRPVTAIRNGDIDANDATELDAGWSSLVEAPMHPEYPSGHSILAAAVATVLKADLGRRPTPMLETSSPTAQGATRQWSRIDDFVQEVSDARVYAGIHYRFATKAGEAMGRRIGELAAGRLRPAPH